MTGRYGRFLLMVALLCLGAARSASADGYILATGSGRISKFDADTGAYLGVFASDPNVPMPYGMTLGPDGNVYVTDGNGSGVHRFDGVTGAYIDRFVTMNGLFPMFGPDGLFYLSTVGSIAQFDGSTGAFIHGFQAPPGPRSYYDLVIGPDGYLYTASWSYDLIDRFDVTTGNWIDTFIDNAQIASPTELVFHTDGKLYVAQWNGEIRRFEAATGAPLGVFASAPESNQCYSALFGPSGNLLASSLAFSHVVQFDGASGASQGVFASDAQVTQLIKAIWLPEPCGNGIVGDSEQCDDGAANSDSLPDACRTTCELAACGDGVSDAGEECDAGAANSDVTADACRTTCVLPSCGDGTTDAGEQCDAGAGNSDTTPDACRTTCVVPICGDAVVDAGESCDDGSANSDSTPNACRTTCALASCGDGIVDSGEACDAGAGNSDSAADTCRTTCVLPTCGYAVVDAGEACYDADTARFDGCDAVCAVEGGFECSGSPSSCVVVPSPQSTSQQKCLVALNKAAAGVSAAWTAESARCMRLAALGLGDASDCLTSGVPLRVQKALAKLVAQESQLCLSSAEQLPVYAYPGSDAIAVGAADHALGLLDDLFGADLDAALVPIASDKAGAACQAALHKAASKVVAISLKAFTACKAGALSGKARQTGVGPVESLAELQDDVQLCLIPSSSIAKAVAKLQTTVAAKCGNVAIRAEPAELGPGCAVSSLGGLLDCADRAAACRFCETANTADGLGMSCDLYDDAAANGSCP